MKNLLLIGLLWFPLAQAQSGWQVLLAKDLPAHEDTIPASNQVVLTPSQQQTANVWGLTQAQMQRVVVLQQRRSHWYYQDRRLTPVELLGLYARTLEERQQWARLAARQLKARVLKEVAFAKALTTVSGTTDATSR